MLNCSIIGNARKFEYEMAVHLRVDKVLAKVIHQFSPRDKTAEPCDDFYAYACGGWERLNPIPDGKTTWSMFEKLHESNQVQKMLLLVS